MTDKDIRENKTLVLGVGNEILMDDGIGPKLVNRLRKNFHHPNLHYENICLGGLEIIEYIRDYRKVVIIDAIKTTTGTPGDVYLMTPDDFKETLHLSTFHDVSFLTALELGKQLGFDIPPEILIIAIEIVEDTLFGESFSPEIQSKYDQIYREICSFLEPALYGEASI
ncbi:MAG: hydrogenase maturation protease [Bacteroidales bacterium]|nr:MAG: hydrogenase maturation protease [Bacteroidales bacterium]